MVGVHAPTIDQLDLPFAATARPTPPASGTSSLGRLLVTVADAGRMLGVGRTTAYELVRAGELDVVHIGRAARVPVDSVHAYVERLRQSHS